MRTCRELRRVVIATVALLCVLAGDAGATHGEISTWGEIDYAAVWAPMEITLSELTVRCNVTLEGSFNASTYAKRAGLQVGEVVEAKVAGCSGGALRVLTERLPWSVTYSSFSGTLPAITGITVNIIGMAFSVEPTGLGASCLALSEASNPMKGIGLVEREGGSGLEIPRIRSEEGSRIPLTGGLCSLLTARIRGTGTNRTGTAEGFLAKLI